LARSAAAPSVRFSALAKPRRETGYFSSASCGFNPPYLTACTAFRIGVDVSRVLLPKTNTFIKVPIGDLNYTQVCRPCAWLATPVHMRRAKESNTFGCIATRGRSLAFFVCWSHCGTLTERVTLVPTSHGHRNFWVMCVGCVEQGQVGFDNNRLDLRRVCS
jgi:hypothetical protein